MHNQLVLGLKGQATKGVLIELWSENAFSQDELIGSLKVDLPYRTANQVLLIDCTHTLYSHTVLTVHSLYTCPTASPTRPSQNGSR
jgi:hypothetical protein